MRRKILMALGLVFLAISCYLIFTAFTLPDVRKALKRGVEPTSTTQVLARDKSVIFTLGKFYHRPVKLGEISPMFVKTLLATEDRRFHQHHGLDPEGIARAMVHNIANPDSRQGGSSITQQLAKNLFLSNERTLDRKVKEAFLALRLERELTKDQILELYLNNAYFGEGAYGVGAASRIYFGKAPKTLTKAEGALLTGLLQAPSLYNPFQNPERAKKRRNQVLQIMAETGLISQAEADMLKKRPLGVNPAGRSLSNSDKAPFFNRHVMRETMKMLSIDEKTFWERGLRIHTTLDPRAQRLAEFQIAQTRSRYGRTGAKQQAALLSIKPTGEIAAYVGGSRFSANQFDHVTQARRPAGSLLKAIVYATAIGGGVSPVSVYNDEPVTFGDWKPENYNRGHYGEITLAQAFVTSNNVVAVKLVQQVSPEAVIATARKMGVEATIEPRLSLALGAADVTLMEMTGAYNVFNNEGRYVHPYAIEKIVSREGKSLHQHKPQAKVVLNAYTRDTMTRMLQGVVLHGTGKAAAPGRDAAGKTGTSDEHRDAWFVGFTPEATTGVWVGNDDNTKMPGVTGGTLPARLWRGYMADLLSGTAPAAILTPQSFPLRDEDFILVPDAPENFFEKVLYQEFPNAGDFYKSIKKKFWLFKNEWWRLQEKH